MMPDAQLAMILLAFLMAIALALGHNGALLFSVTSMIAAIGGYKTREALERKRST